MIVLALLLSAAPAEPEIVNPLPTQRVQLQGPSDLWGMRKVARYLNQHSPLRIYRAGSCEQRPQAVCIRVKVRRYDEPWWGKATVGADPGTIWLDKADRRSRGVACHELLHAVGMDHHDQPGCMTQLRRQPSHAEMRALRQEYRER